MRNIRIINNTSIEGKHHAIGEELKVRPEVAADLVTAGKAVELPTYKVHGAKSEPEKVETRDPAVETRDPEPEKSEPAKPEPEKPKKGK